MTHPIPGADSERECRKTCDVCFDEVGQEWPCARRKARAAAKAGANVAADIPTWLERRNASDGSCDDKKYMKDEIADLRARLAAGAPAETLEGTLQRCAMMLDTIKMEWSATNSWSKYDQSVRDEITQWLGNRVQYPVFANPDRLKAGAPAHFLASRPTHTTAPAETVKAAPYAWVWHEPASEWNGYKGKRRIAFDKPEPCEAPKGCTPLYAHPTTAPGDGEKDAARLDFLDQQSTSYGFEDMHEGNKWEIGGPYATIRNAIDAAIAAVPTGATKP
jgi:hypothetical protein